jgi:hypothetical protein
VRAAFQLERLTGRGIKGLTAALVFAEYFRHHASATRGACAKVLKP